MVTESKSKGGRPRRAGSEKLKKMSISIRQVAFESLELLARQRRTSVSQVIEHLALAAGRETEINGTAVFTAANQIANIEDGPRGDLLRMALIPADLRTAFEGFAVDVLDAIGDYSEITDDEAAILVAVIHETLPTSGEASFAAAAWREACKAHHMGSSSFEIDDSYGNRHAYDIQEGAKGDPMISVSYEAMMKPLEAMRRVFEGVPVSKPNPTPRGPVPKGGKKPTAK